VGSSVSDHTHNCTLVSHLPLPFLDPNLTKLHTVQCCNTMRSVPYLGGNQSSGNSRGPRRQATVLAIPIPDHARIRK